MLVNLVNSKISMATVLAAHTYMVSTILYYLFYFPNLLNAIWIVPCSSERMLNKSLETPSDVIIYDLEDSVAPDAKPGARTALGKFFNVSTQLIYHNAIIL